MKRSVFPFLGACLLAAAAGVAIAGVPSGAASDAGTVVIAPPDPTVPAGAEVATTVPGIEPVREPIPPGTTLAAATVPSSEPAPAAAATSVPDTAAPTTVPPSTVPPSTVPPSTVPDGAARADLSVATVNAQGSAGVAGRGAELLETLGYTDIARIDSVDPSPTSGLYYRAGLEFEALRLKGELGHQFLPVDTIDHLPPVDDESGRAFDLVLVLGLDYESLIPPS